MYNHLVFHHSASPQHTQPVEIEGWHKERGISPIGYHFIIHRLWRDGPWTVSTGRPLLSMGAHAKGDNLDSLGICICGDYTKEKLHRHAIDLAGRLAASLLDAEGLRYDAIYPHSGVGTTETSCPGYDISTIIKRTKIAYKHQAWRNK